MARAPRYATYERPHAARMATGTQVVPDSSIRFLPAAAWLGAEGRDLEGSAEKRSEGLLTANRGLLRDLGIEADTVRQRGRAGIVVRTSTRVGAVPLLSPVTGRPDFGLVVEPRFAWASVGEMLAGTGFRVVPDLLPLPDLPQSERRVPPWVLSSIVLRRLRTMLDALQRRFVMSSADLAAPRGAVDWTRYAARFAQGRALDVPCRFPDLRDDEEVRSAIHWTVRRHRDALLTQTAAGTVVRELLVACGELLAQVGSTPARVPRRTGATRLSSPGLMSRVFKEGLQAIEWTVDERGLAGLSELSGLSWRMDMETFFEAWVEAVVEHAARRSGARVRAGRTEGTRVPLDWTPPSAGSQRSLLPDVVLERDDVVVVVDAKYKRHASEIERLGWSGASAELKEQHRADVLQALAYSTLFDAPRVVACLAYPADAVTWRGLAAAGRVCSRARVRTGARAIELALVAVPLSGQREEAARAIEALIARAV